MARLPRSGALLVTACALALLAGPASAGAASTCVTAPGTSAADQYCETVPAAGGGGTSTGAGNAKGDPAAALPPGTAERLNRPGTTNAGVRDLVATGPVAQQRTAAGKRRGAAAGTAEGPGGKAEPAATGTKPGSAGGESVSPLGAVASAVSAGPSLGAGLPLALLATAIAAVGVVWIRSRNRSPS